MDGFAVAKVGGQEHPPSHKATARQGERKSVYTASPNAFATAPFDWQALDKRAGQAECPIFETLKS